MDLNGDASVIKQAREILKTAGEPVAGGLGNAGEDRPAALRLSAPKTAIHIDLAELRGYRYHTGIVFAAFAPGHGREIARGGRYDGVGAEFGATRPATGFSADMNELLRLRQGEAALVLSDIEALNTGEHMGKSVVVIGAQWGDEGKGKVVDLLTAQRARPWCASRAATTPATRW